MQPGMIILRVLWFPYRFWGSTMRVRNRTLQVQQPRRTTVSQLHAFVSRVLNDGTIDDADTESIRQTLASDQRIDLNDVKLLVDLYCSASQRSARFDELFFNVLEQVLLADGQVQPSEQFYLLKMLYSDREVRPRERDFLRRLQTKAQRTPEFDALCEAAFQSADRDWSVGGRS
jgi:uncharacterized tellurite resistance protein B-like protein